MKQPQTLGTVLTQQLQQTSSLSQTPTTSLTKPEQDKRLLISKRFGNCDSFLQKVHPQTQAAFATKQKQAIMGDYPTLTDICLTYGKTFSEQWLYPQIADLAMFTGAKNLTKEQMRGLASVIAVEYRYLKVTELLLFFYRFKTGRYGRFYGSVDPMVITCALREFMKERNTLIDIYERELHDKELEQQKLLPTISREQWEAMKQAQLESKSETKTE